MKKLEIVRFPLGDTDYYVEVMPSDSTEGYTDFWLCKVKYGMKNYMFGIKAPEDEWKDFAQQGYDYIDGFEEDMEILESEFERRHFHADDECDGNCTECECCMDGGLAEAIEMHNDHVDKMQELGETLMETYPDVEETAVNEAFCEAFKGLVGNAIYLCCEANSTDCEDWMTDGSWHVVCKVEE